MCPLCFLSLSPREIVFLREWIVSLTGINKNLCHVRKESSWFPGLESKGKENSERQKCYFGGPQVWKTWSTCHKLKFLREKLMFVYSFDLLMVTRHVKFCWIFSDKQIKLIPHNLFHPISRKKSTYFNLHWHHLSSPSWCPRLAFAQTRVLPLEQACSNTINQSVFH